MRRVLMSVTACLLATSAPRWTRSARADAPPDGAATHTIKPAATPLYRDVVTKQPRAELSAFLVEPATRAAKARDYARAIPLYRALVVARGAGSPESKELATLWTRANQHEQAADAWTAYATHAPDEAERKAAVAEATRLRALRDPFADKLVLAPLTAEARRAFTAARRAYAATHHADALVLFYVGHALAPDTPNYIRELVATYDRLNAPRHKQAFFHTYLSERPLGPNADLVRTLVAADPTARTTLGTLTLSSSLPCTEIWINRQRLTKLPAKGILVAPGTYKGLCFSPKHEMALFEYATVTAGQSTTMAFRWAIVENRLEKPLGRIALENPKTPGTMIDLGITTRDIGVAAPADANRKLEMILRDDTGTRTERREVQIVPGQRLVVRW